MQLFDFCYFVLFATSSESKKLKEEKIVFHLSRQFFFYIRICFGENFFETFFSVTLGGILIILLSTI